jgi:hypothetical protein
MGMTKEVEEAIAVYEVRGWRTEWIDDQLNCARLYKHGVYCSIKQVQDEDQAVAVTWVVKDTWLTEEFFPPN